MIENPYYPAAEIRRFNQVAIVSDAGNYHYTVAGSADILTPELARTILLGVLWENGFPVRIKEFRDTSPENDHWKVYYVEVEVT